MNPLTEYNELILTRQRNPLPEGTVTEEHHIWPTSCGGPDEDWNKVRLTPEEHFKAHKLLLDLYTDPKHRDAMRAAIWLMAHTRDGVKLSPEEYGELKRNFVKRLKERASPTLGWHPTEEQRKHYSDAQKGKPHFFKKGQTPWNKGTKGLTHHTEEWKKAQSERCRGRHHTEESRRKMREAAQRRTTNSFTGRHHTEEAKQRNRVAHLGKRHTAETRAKISATLKARAKAGYPKKS